MFNMVAVNGLHGLSALCYLYYYLRPSIDMPVRVLT